MDVQTRNYSAGHNHEATLISQPPSFHLAPVCLSPHPCVASLADIKQRPVQSQEQQLINSLIQLLIKMLHSLLREFLSLDGRVCSSGRVWVWSSAGTLPSPTSRSLAWVPDEGWGGRRGVGARVKEQKLLFDSFRRDLTLGSITNFYLGHFCAFLGEAMRISAARTPTKVAR